VLNLIPAEDVKKHVFFWPMHYGPTRYYHIVDHDVRSEGRLRRYGKLDSSGESRGHQDDDAETFRRSMDEDASMLLQLSTKLD
jgi:hypothetical protein